MTAPKTLADLQPGDDVALISCGTLVSSKYKFNRMERVTKVTPKRIRCGGMEFGRATGKTTGPGSSLIRVPTEDDLEQHAAQLDEYRANKAAEAEEQRIRAAAEMVAVREIAAAFDDDWISLADRYALAQRIGLPTLRAFADAVKAAKEKL